MRTAAAIASVLAVAALPACDAGYWGGSGGVTTSGGAKAAESDPPRSGSRSTARSSACVVAADAPDEFAGLTTSTIDAFCGTKEEFGPFGASARALGKRFPKGQRELAVTLSKDVEEDVAFCGIEAKDGAAEAFAFFVPLAEILED